MLQLNSKILKLIVVLGCLTLLAACGAQNPKILRPRSSALQSSAPNPQALLRINSLYIAPPLYSEQARRVHPEGYGIYSLLYRAAAESLELELSRTDLDLLESGKGVKNRSGALDLARSRGMDGALICFVNSIKENSGSKLGSDSPARVGLSFEVVDSESGRSVWTASYFFEDQALSENLLDLKQNISRQRKRPGWQSARDLLGQGVREAISDFAQRRQQEFTN